MSYHYDRGKYEEAQRLMRRRGRNPQERADLHQRIVALLRASLTTHRSG